MSASFKHLTSRGSQAPRRAKVALRRAFVMACSAFMIAACGGNLDMLGMFWTLSPTVNERFQQSMDYKMVTEPLVFSVPSSDYDVYVCTDVHVDETTNNLDAFVADYLADADAAPFALCLGDIINATGHYELFMDHIKPILDSPVDTLLCTVGNHDIYYNQWDIYRSYFKTSTYTFEVQMPGGMKDLWICLDSGAGTVGSKQMEWLEKTLANTSKAGYRHTIIFTHTHFFRKDDSQSHTSNFNTEEGYALMNLFSENGVDLVLSGHDHYRETTHFKGVEYRVIDALQDHYPNAFYAIITLSDKATALPGPSSESASSGISFRWVPVGPQE